MAKEKTEENSFVKQAKRIGFNVMLHDVNELLSATNLSEGLRITNEEIKTQIMQYLEDLK